MTFNWIISPLVGLTHLTVRAHLLYFKLLFFESKTPNSTITFASFFNRTSEKVVIENLCWYNCLPNYSAHSSTIQFCLSRLAGFDLKTDLSDVDRAGKATIVITVKFAKVAVHTGPVQSHSSAIVRSFGVVKIARLISTFAAIVLVKTAHDVTTSMAISVAHVPPASLVSLASYQILYPLIWNIFWKSILLSI